MKRIMLGNGKWFDDDKAERFKEETYWNGNNYISQATRSQGEHEELFRTAKGAWFLHHWSQWQGSMPYWEEISQEAAIKWLLVNEYTGYVEDNFPGALESAEV